MDSLHFWKKALSGNPHKHYDSERALESFSFELFFTMQRDKVYRIDPQRGRRGSISTGIRGISNRAIAFGIRL